MRLPDSRKLIWPWQVAIWRPAGDGRKRWVRAFRWDLHVWLENGWRRGDEL